MGGGGGGIFKIIIYIQKAKKKKRYQINTHQSFLFPSFFFFFFFPPQITSYKKNFHLWVFKSVKFNGEFLGKGGGGIPSPFSFLSLFPRKKRRASH